MIGDGYDTLILQWVADLGDIVEACISEREYLSEFEDMRYACEFINNNFSKKILLKCLATHMLPNEIINAAMCFNNGLGYDDVQHFANQGYLECGYLPKSAEEKGVFSLAIVKEPINQTILFANTETGAIIEILSAAMNNMSKDGNYYTKLVEKKCSSPQEVFIYECPELNEAFKTALGNTTAFKELVIYEPTENKLQVMGLSGSASQENGIKIDGFI